MVTDEEQAIVNAIGGVHHRRPDRVSVDTYHDTMQKIYACIYHSFKST